MKALPWLLLPLLARRASAQDYEVADISCAFSGAGELTARLRKPEGFAGDPVFADARRAGDRSQRHCRIRPDQRDEQGLIYDLQVDDLDECGVVKKNVSESDGETISCSLFRASSMCECGSPD